MLLCVLIVLLIRDIIVYLSSLVNEPNIQSYQNDQQLSGTEGMREQASQQIAYNTHREICTTAITV